MSAINNPKEAYVDRLLSYPKLNKDDVFTYGCNECGACCRNREDILLSPLDLYKMAKHLNMSIKDVIKDYCEFYEGEDSRLPVVRIKPREYKKTCPLNDYGKCKIHAVKPTVCALYPLGRATDNRTNEFFYFLQPVSCGNRSKTQTVTQWLESFTILEEEHLAMLWHEYAGRISTILHQAAELKESTRTHLFIILFHLLYLEYNLEKSFDAQFKKNCEHIFELLATMPKKE